MLKYSTASTVGPMLKSIFVQHLLQSYLLFSTLQTFRWKILQFFCELGSSVAF